MKYMYQVLFKFPLENNDKVFMNADCCIVEKHCRVNSPCYTLSGALSFLF